MIPLGICIWCGDEMDPREGTLCSDCIAENLRCMEGYDKANAELVEQYSVKVMGEYPQSCSPPSRIEHKRPSRSTWYKSVDDFLLSI